MRDPAERLIVGTRGSKLALTQTRWAIQQIRAANSHVTVSERIISTQGDRIQDRPLANIGEKGLFVKELETALSSGEVDAAVHSLKDLPSDLAPGFSLAALPQREDPRDCLVSPRFGGLQDLPQNAVVGTGSPRRKAQLLALRPDLVVRDIRGNVDTRIRKAAEGDYDGVLLAVAGLNRLGLSDSITEIFEPSQMIPAVGQGALAIEAREGDTWTGGVLAVIDDSEARITVEAERALAKALGASCTVPLGALATLEDGHIYLRAVLADGTGDRLIIEDETGSLEDPQGLGNEVAARMMALGAGAILERFK